MNQRQLGAAAAIILTAGVFACSSPSGGEGAPLQEALKDECGPPFLVADLNPGANSTDIREIAHIGDIVVFTVFEGSGSSLWRSDGTAAGTVKIHDAVSTGGFIAAVAGKIYFSADDGVHGSELWSTDGTAAGTFMVADVNPGAASSFANGFTERDGKVYFSARSGVSTAQLWVTDGTAAGTMLVKDISADPSGFPAITRMVVVPGGNLFFFGSDGVHGLEPWTSDGTAEGTRMLGDLLPGPDSSVTNAAAAAAGAFFFTADDGVHGRELWRSDATGTITELFLDLVPGPGTPNPFLLDNLDDRLIFVANDGVSGQEPWISDGTVAGTHVLVDVNPGSASSFPAPFTVAQGRVYFPAFEPEHGKELWVSDGIDSHMVRDIRVGPGGTFPGDPNGMYAVEKSVVFDANDRVNGDELWWSAGNANKTQLADIATGPGDSSPFQFQRAGSLLYFAADDLGAAGRELRAVPVACVIKGIPAQ
jgi:ELWxxDGT repeat protein